MKPSSAEAKAISRREMPEVFMMAPARMNMGMASSGNLVAPSYMTSARFGSIASPRVKKTAAMANRAQRNRDRHVDQDEAEEPGDHQQQDHGAASSPLLSGPPSAGGASWDRPARTRRR